MMSWSSFVHPSTDLCCVWGFEWLGGDAVCRFAQPDHHRDLGNQHRGVCVGRNGRKRQAYLHEAQTGQFTGEQWPGLCLGATKIRWSGSSSQLLYGHTDSVTCLATSEAHSLIVSGSCDLTCILWDMEELGYITQLTGHTASISSLAINDLTVSSPHSHCCHGVPFNPFKPFGRSDCHCWQLARPRSHSFSFVALLPVHLCNPLMFVWKGEIVSCAGPFLYLWNMKGQLLSRSHSSVGPLPDTLCISFTQHREWDPRNVIITGCADGIIRVRFPPLWSTNATVTLRSSNWLSGCMFRDFLTGSFIQFPM